MKTCYQLLKDLHQVCYFQTQGGARVGPASNTELRRFLDSNSVEINFKKVKSDDEIPPVIKSIVLFPSSGKRCTLFFDNDVRLIQLEDV